MLLAAVDAMAQPEYTLRHVAMSTGPHTPFVVVNGPIAERIGMNSGRGVLGPGKPSKINLVIGRAIRLIMMNIGYELSLSGAHAVRPRGEDADRGVAAGQDADDREADLDPPARRAAR